MSGSKSGSRKKREVRQVGFICWYDVTSDDGILRSLDGQEYYFNSWSFPKTHWVVTGKSKKTGRKKTVRTRLFPGLFLSRKREADSRVHELETNTPVTFEQADGIDMRWAVGIKIAPKYRLAVFKHRLASALSARESLNLRTRSYQKVWKPYYTKRTAHYKAEISALGGAA